MAQTIRRRTERTKLRRLRVALSKMLPELMAAAFTTPKYKEIKASLDALSPVDRREVVKLVREAVSSGIAKELEALRSALLRTQ